MATVTINVEQELRAEQTDLRECTFCKDMIFTDMNRLWIMVGKRESKTKICLCNSCKGLYESENK